MRIEARPVAISAPSVDVVPRGAPPARPTTDVSLHQGRAGGATLDRAADVSCDHRDRTGRFTALIAHLKRLFGMPDYARYLEHQARRHPGESVLSEREYVKGELERKYAGGGGRCC